VDNPEYPNLFSHNLENHLIEGFAITQKPKLLFSLHRLRALREPKGKKRACPN
jgi:hypothetical protein